MTITWILLVILIIITLLYIFYKRLITVSLLLLRIIFPLLLIISLSALFVPSVYRSIVDWTFQQNNITKEVDSLNQTANNPLQLSPSLLDSVNNLFGRPTQQTQQNNGFVNNIYQSLLDLIAGILRWLTFIVSVIGLIVILYLRYTFDSIGDLVKLKKANADLETRMHNLESRLTTTG